MDKQIQALKESRKEYIHKMFGVGSLEDDVKMWVNEIKEQFQEELTTLSNNNAELITTNELLMQQVAAMEGFKQQLTDVAEGQLHIDLEGVFLNTSEYSILHREMVNTGNQIWKDIKGRTQKIIDRPWEALGQKVFQSRLEFFQSQNEVLQAKVQVYKQQVLDLAKYDPANQPLLDSEDDNQEPVLSMPTPTDLPTQQFDGLDNLVDAVCDSVQPPSVPFPEPVLVDLTASDMQLPPPETLEGEQPGSAQPDLI